MIPGLAALLVLVAVVFLSRGSYLLSATERGQESTVNSLILLRADVNKNDEYGRTPLYIAADRGNLTLVKRLLDAGADPTIYADLSNEASPAQAAMSSVIRNGSPYRSVGTLTTSSSGSFGYTPPAEVRGGIVRDRLTYGNDRIEIAVLLIAGGADIDIKSVNYPTMLHFAAIYGSSRSVKILLESGADPNVGNDNGVTPLHIAAEINGREIVADLINAGADPNVGNDNGVTPLHIAAEINGREIVADLINAGADPTVADLNGDTPLHTVLKKLALYTERGDVDSIPNVSSVVEELVEAGADIKAPNQVGTTPQDLSYQACGTWCSRIGEYNRTCSAARGTVANCQVNLVCGERCHKYVRP
jgi:ankyrin repeat protein